MRGAGMLSNLSLVMRWSSISAVLAFKSPQRMTGAPLGRAVISLKMSEKVSQGGLDLRNLQLELLGGT